MTNSPCAILITPMTPKVTARPSAARSNTDPSESPWNSNSPARRNANCRSMRATAASIASAKPALPVRASSNTVRAASEPEAPRLSIPARFSASSSEASRAAPCAKTSLSRMRGTVSRASAASKRGKSCALRLRKIPSAARKRSAGSGETICKRPSALRSAARTRLLMRTGLAPVASAGAPVSASASPMRSAPSGIRASLPSASACKSGKPRGSPLRPSFSTASACSPKLPPRRSAVALKSFCAKQMGARPSTSSSVRIKRFMEIVGR